jgi:hypothetical protein
MINEIKNQYGQTPSQRKSNENPIVTELKSVVAKFTKEQLEDVVVSEKKLREILASVKQSKNKLSEAKEHERILLATIEKLKK